MRKESGEKWHVSQKTVGTFAALDHELIDGKTVEPGRCSARMCCFTAGEEGGNVIALNDRCPHRGALLSKGRLEGRWACVACTTAIKYDGTGKWRADSWAGHDSRQKLKVRGYPVVERSHFIWVWMGDTAKSGPRADHRSSLPERSELEKGIPAYLHYDAELSADRRQPERFSRIWRFVHTKKRWAGRKKYAFIHENRPS